MSANFTSVGIGTETDGSIICPASISGVVGIKPTVGLVSRAGVVPLSHTQDTPGPHARTVADAAAVLGAIQSKTFDGRDPATGGVPLGWSGTGRTRPTNIPTDYTQFLNPDGLNGVFLGLWSAGSSALATPMEAAAFDAAIQAMKDAGAHLITFDFEFAAELSAFTAELLVLLYDFKNDLKAYLANRTGVPIHSLADAIAFNNAHAAAEMPFFGQEIFEQSQALDTSDPDAQQPGFGMSYNEALATDRRIGGTHGIDKVLSDLKVEAIVASSAGLAWATDLIYGDRPGIFTTQTPAATVGYPIINVPMALVKGLPLGVSFFGTAFSEPTLIKLASGFEHVMHARRVPKFIKEIGLNPHLNPGDPGDQGGNHQDAPDLLQRPAMI